MVFTATPEEQRALVDSYYDISELVLADPESAADDIKALQETGSLAVDRLDDRDRTEIAAVSAAYREKHGTP